MEVDCHICPLPCFIRTKLLWLIGVFDTKFTLYVLLNGIDVPSHVHHSLSHGLSPVHCRCHPNHRLSGTGARCRARDDSCRLLMLLSTKGCCRGSSRHHRTCGGRSWATSLGLSSPWSEMALSLSKVSSLPSTELPLFDGDGDGNDWQVHCLKQWYLREQERCSPLLTHRRAARSLPPTEWPPERPRVPSLQTRIDK